MLNTQLSIYKGQPRHELRVDWRLRQFVDKMREMVAEGVCHKVLAAAMKERGVPYHVADRVLSGR